VTKDGHPSHAATNGRALFQQLETLGPRSDDFGPDGARESQVRLEMPSHFFLSHANRGISVRFLPGRVDKLSDEIVRKLVVKGPTGANWPAFGSPCFITTPAMSLRD
jgi:hypothetical protein